MIQERLAALREQMKKRNIAISVVISRNANFQKAFSI